MRLDIQLPYLPTEIAEQALMLLYGILFIIQMIYLWGVFSKLAFFRKKEEVESGEAVSVVISARSEYFNLKHNLPILLDQDYPEFEIVVVNDNSQDESLQLLEDLARDHKNLKIVNLSQDLNFFRGKKFPLSIGIKSASYDIILLTDADCKPTTRQWIRNMAGRFRGEKDIVLGYGGYERRQSLINMLIRHETVWTAIQYLSFALIGKTYMGVGRNMAYRKSLFYKNKGFSSHYTIASGDDDLFINSVATKTNVAIEVGHNSHTLSVPKTSFSGWIKQKRRHLTTWKYYRRKFKWLLGLWSLSQAFFPALFVVLLLLNYNLIITLSVFLVRIVSYLLITKLCMNRLNEKKLLVFSPVAELFLVLFYPLLSLVNVVSKPDKWK
jgi:cellulose synthase/poly-beta-1,6-N-acetylglucosamine synthase-like glycosyltransferase